MVGSVFVRGRVNWQLFPASLMERDLLSFMSEGDIDGGISGKIGAKQRSLIPRWTNGRCHAISLSHPGKMAGIGERMREEDISKSLSAWNSYDSEPCSCLFVFLPYNLSFLHQAAPLKKDVPMQITLKDLLNVKLKKTHTCTVIDKVNLNSCTRTNYG